MTNPRANRRSRRPLSEPDGRLPDGSPLYGEIGVLAVDPENGQVQCAACGQWFNTIGGAHLTLRHGLTVEQYQRITHPHCQATSTPCRTAKPASGSS